MLKFKLMAPADDGDTGGGAGDRGDAWEPTELDEPVVDEAAVAAAAAATAAVDQLAADKVIADEAAAAKVIADEGKTPEELAAEKVVADAEKAAAGKKDSRIPAARHQEILNKERARRETVEAELAALKRGQTAVQTTAAIAKSETDLVTLEERHAQESLDGKTAEAAKTMTAIRKLERSIIEAQSTARIEAAESRAVERVRYDTACDRVEAAYPQLNESHADFDAEKSAEVVELQKAYQMTGLTQTQALQKAVKVLMPPETAKQEAAVVVTPKVTDKAALEKARVKTATEKVTDALAKTPASTAKVGADSDKAGGGTKTAADVIKMSQKDFASLDEATLARMRGDDFAGG